MPEPVPPGRGRTAAAKLRLNAAQWKTLQKLANDETVAEGGDGPTTAWARLTSNGLVATDRKGCAYVTLSGWHRLRQGR